MKKLFLMLLLCAPLTLFAQTAKFGHVDAQAVMQSLPEFIKARGELEAQSKQYENDMKAMQDEIQKKSDEYDRTKSTMNETKRQETEASLQQLFQKYQQALQDNMQPIMNKIMTAIKNVGKAGGYVYIMDTSSGIPYISDTLSKDVTNDVKAEMNKLK